MKRVFADTSYFIAVIVADDAAHARAQALDGQRLHVVTSAWIMMELGAFLSAANRAIFNILLSKLRASPSVDFVPVSQDPFDRAAELYAARPDKEWSLVDCTSFLIMQDRNLTDALTTDHHFTQAGFNAMLADEGK